MAMEEYVWAKLGRKLKPWPGKICTPPEIFAKPDLNPSKWIYFFGVRKFAWVQESNIKSYLENRNEIVKTIKEKCHKDAIKEMDEYMEDPEKFKAHFVEENVHSEDNKSPKVNRGGLRTKKVVIKKEPGTTRRKTDNAVVEGPVEKRQRNSPTVGASHKSTSLQKTNMETSTKTFGFIGVGLMGSRIVKQLIDYGHKVFVWDIDPSKTEDLRNEVGVQVATSLGNLAEEVDIIFVCVSDPLALTELIFGEYKEMFFNQHFNGKGYVEMTCLDSDTSKNIAHAIISRGGRYLEAQLVGSTYEAEEGSLVLLTAGDESLFNECQSCFHAMGKNSFFLGGVGNASKMYLVVQSLRAVQLGALTEALALANRSRLPQEHVLEVFGITPVASKYLLEKGREIVNQNYEPHQRLRSLQNDLKLTLVEADKVNQEMPLTAAVNEVFKLANQKGLSQYDDIAVYKALK